MATKTIAWNTGTGNITVVYGGSGDGTATITSSDNNLYEARSQQITFQTTAGSPQRTVTVTVAQAAKQKIDLSNAIVTATNQTYSGSALTPTPIVALNGETIPSTGYDVAYSNNTNAGTATITITGKGDYTGTAIGTFTIAKADPTYTQPTGYSYTYNRSARSLITTGSTSDGTIQYSGDGTTWSTTRPTATNAGTYTAYWRLIGDANHNDVAKSAVTTTIAKATPVINVAPSLVTGLTYNTSAQNLLSGGSFKHSSTDSTAVAGTFVYEQGTNAGTYEDPEFTFTPTDTTNYNTVSAYRVGTVTIAQATGQVTTIPTARNVTYTGSNQYLVTAGSGTGTIQYRYKLTTATSWSSWSSTRARRINAGTYDVQYRAAASSDGNYTVSAVGSLTVELKKKALIITAVAQTISYGSSINTGTSYVTTATLASTDTLSAITLTASTSNVTTTGTITPSAATIMRSSTTATANYTITYVTGNLTITAVAPTYTAPTAKSLTYNTSAQALVNAGTASGGTMYYYATTTNSKPSSTTSFTTTIPTKTNAGTYYVWYYVKGDSNHNDTAISSTSVSVTIAKANRTISFTTAPTSVEIGATITVVAAPSAGSGDGTITYSSSNTSKATVSGNIVTGVAVGTVNITATISAGTNYNSATTSYSLGVTEIIYENHYLTFVALETGTFTFTNHGSGNNIQYSINGGSTWVSLASATASPSVAAGSKIMWKSTRTPGNATDNYGVGTFNSTGRFDVEGNAMSMLYGDNFTGIESIEAKRGGIGTLFKDCVNLVNAENLKLPPLTLSINAYLRLFSGCTSLVTAPELPATVMAGMQSYLGMFYGCTSLIEAPEINITTITDWGCCQMFRGCTALTKAPSILPATTPIRSCYGEMFYQCSSLQKAPELPAEVLAHSCYASMFAYCSKLNYIKMMATDISATNCLGFWVGGVASTGTFVKNSAATWSVTGNNGVPNGWTVETASS